MQNVVSSICVRHVFEKHPQLIAGFSHTHDPMRTVIVMPLSNGRPASRRLLPLHLRLTLQKIGLQLFNIFRRGIRNAGVDVRSLGESRARREPVMKNLVL